MTRSIHPAPPASGGRARARWALLAFSPFFAGALLLAGYGRRSVFHLADLYETVALWSVLLCTPLVFHRLRRNEAFSKQLAMRLSSVWLRTWIVMPLTAAMLVGGVFAAPLGWSIAVAAWSGDPVQLVRATATDVGDYAQRRGCNQTATLRFASVDKRTCLDDLYPPSSMQPGQPLDVGIVPFRFGFLIVSIAPAVPAAP